MNNNREYRFLITGNHGLACKKSVLINIHTNFKEGVYHFVVSTVSANDVGLLCAGTSTGILAIKFLILLTHWTLEDLNEIQSDFQVIFSDL